MTRFRRVVELFRTARRGGPARRRGTILLMALGVLGILAIVALSYVTIVRIDRASAIAVSRESNYQQQVTAVIGHIQDLVAADLFGNKVVTNATPLQSGGQRVWPRMFEDGEARDMPVTRTQSNGDEFAQPASAMGVDSAAPSDDAWLASIEPAWTDPYLDPSGTTRWPQLTNLRSAWYFNQRANRWERSDGRFVDLGQWFLKSRGNYADPGVDLLDWGEVTSDGQLGPGKGLDQLVFQHQINEMATVTPPQDSPGPAGQVDPLTGRDDRQFADTDGDLRPDARWTQLESMGNLFNLNWVVAARIIDASALVNVNTAIEFGDQLNAANLADGRTPADVDLYRLLKNSARLGVYDQTVQPPLELAFEDHLKEGLGMERIIEEIRTTNNVARYSGLNPFTTWRFATRMDPLQRFAYYEWFGNSPVQPRARLGVGYPQRDMMDLEAFWGTNYATLLSKVEQRLDGPEANGYLPSPTPPNTSFGPLRAKETGIVSRRLDPDGPLSAAQKGLPTSEQIRDSARRLLTTVSGEGDFSPVPVLNADASYDNTYRLQKVPITGPLPSDGVRRAFESFVWALAPLATDRPLDEKLRQSNQYGAGAVNRRYHYGGDNAIAPNGPASYMDFEVGGGVDDNAAFAVITSAMLAANLSDALDDYATIKGREPTVIRLYNNVNQKDDPATNDDYYEFGTRLPQGDIPPGNLEPTINSTGSDTSITMVGLERQPFLREAFTLVALSDDASLNPNVLTSSIVGDQPDEVIGCAFGVELANPWSNRVKLDGFTVVIPSSPAEIVPSGGGPAPIRLKMPDEEIPAGGTAVIFWRFANTGSGSWDDIGAKIDLVIATASGSSIVRQVDDTFLLSGARRNIFSDMAGANAAPRPVLLMREVVAARDINGNATQTEEVLVDRMTPSVTFPDVIDPAGYNMLLADTTRTVLFNGAISLPGAQPLDANYFQLKGLTAQYRYQPGIAVDTRLTNNQITGRVIKTSSVTRPGAQSAKGGFPAYVMEHPGNAVNSVRTTIDVDAWIYPYDPDGANGVVGDADDIDPAGSPAPLATAGVMLDDFQFPTRHEDLGKAAKLSDDPSNLNPDWIPPFQLFVPKDADRGFHNASEILMLCPYAHTCRDHALGDLTKWITVQERLGRSLAYDFSLAVPATPDAANPYLACLDPSRYVLKSLTNGDLGNSNGVAESMAIPLALRAPMCFDAVTPGQDRLTQGRINLNTAPGPVLQTLPLVAPEFNVGPPGSDLLANATLDQPDNRAQLILNYRDPAQWGTTPAQWTSLGGLRERDSSDTSFQGMVSPAELAVLDTWDPAPTRRGQLRDSPPPAGFAMLGANNAANDESPLQVAARSLDLQTATAGLVAPSGANLNPTDDAEERLALYRAVSNIATVRSDVFIAWLVIRGYDPEVIEKIPVTNGQELRAMDDPAFKPAYESRWLAVLDRSNVVKPTDRPRVLLMLELPSAAP